MNYREEAVKLLLLAVRNGEVSTSDEIFEAVTEGRYYETARRRAAERVKFGAPRSFAYSSCGDLGHWLLYRLGVREPYINRQEHTGWKTGVNVSRLCAWPVGSRRIAKLRPGPTYIFHPGDILVVGAVSPSSTHVSVVVEADGEKLTTADYGQPGGRLITKPYTVERNRLRRGSRLIDSVLDLGTAVEHARAVGQLADLQTADEWAAAKGITQ